MSVFFPSRACCSLEGEVKRGSHSMNGRINSNWLFREDFKESQCSNWGLKQEENLVGKDKHPFHCTKMQRLQGVPKRTD